MGGPDAGRCFLVKADLDAPDDLLRRLRADPPVDSPPDAAALGRAIETILGRPVATPVQRWARGTFHWVARGELADGSAIATRVLRLVHPLLRDAMGAGIAAAAAARGAGLPAPESFGAALEGTDVGAPLAIHGWLAGTPLSDRDDDEPTVLGALGELGGLLRTLHGVAGRGAGRLIAGPTGLQGEHRGWDDFIRCRLETHLAACAGAGVMTAAEVATAARVFGGTVRVEGPVDRLLHGDPGPANLVTDAGGAVRGLLDWEDAMVGDPIFEVAGAAGFHPERRWPALFEGYYGRGGLRREDARPFWIYFLRIALARTVARARFGVADRPGRAPAARRIQRALAALEER